MVPLHHHVGPQGHRGETVVKLWQNIPRLHLLLHVIGLVLIVDVHPLVATPQQPHGELTHLTVCQLVGDELQGEGEAAQGQVLQGTAYSP